MQTSHSLRVNATPVRLFCRFDKVMIITIHAAETQLSRLIDAALAGEDVVIVRGDKPLVRLSPLAPPPGFASAFWRRTCPPAAPIFLHRSSLTNARLGKAPDPAFGLPLPLILRPERPDDFRPIALRRFCQTGRIGPEREAQRVVMAFIGRVAARPAEQGPMRAEPLEPL